MCIRDSYDIRSIYYVDMIPLLYQNYIKKEPHMNIWSAICQHIKYQNVVDLFAVYHSIPVIGIKMDSMLKHFSIKEYKTNEEMLAIKQSKLKKLGYSFDTKQESEALAILDYILRSCKIRTSHYVK